MRLLIDTNRYSDFARGVLDVVAAVEQADAVFMAYVTIGELRAGFVAGTRGRQNERDLTEFLNRPGVGVLFPDIQTTHPYAHLYRQLRSQGTPIPDNDLWIAALVVQHGLTLYSRDRHFDHLPQLARL
jgi:tRNA(fMet)-specific endonuclease VapC